MSTLAAQRFVCLLMASALASVILPSAVASADEAASADLPLARVVLFTAGVGFFEHRGDLEGRRTVELKFNVDEVNDLLKSMVVEDAGGGHVATVSYGSREPITKTLRTFAIDLTQEPTLADLLRQVRGEKVVLEMSSPVSGAVVGVERRRKQVGKEEVLDVDVVNVLTDSGLRSVPLDDITTVRLVDKKLNAELQEALAILALAHATDKKTVTLDFRGEGKRAVRVGYIQESPVWKTSYRLVIKDNEPPLLQGWAIVENTTEQDWNDVQLSLVSGRPISFVMDLYQPMFVNRPLVVPELFASLHPRTYEQDLTQRNAEFRRQIATGSKPLVSGRGGISGFSGIGGGLGGGLGGGGSFGGAAAGAGPEGGSTVQLPSFDPGKGVQAAGTAAEVGELFRYNISAPVKLPRRQSAMLPIVNDSIQGEKLSIYNAAVHGKHPLNAYRLKNTTSLHLMQGPITVFDGGEYAGDARIADLTPATERLISYALDLDVEVAPTPKTRPESFVGLKLVKGVAHTSYRHWRSQAYTIKNSGTKPRRVYIEQPVDVTWRLVSPTTPAEKTRNLYRFAVEAEPGKAKTLEVEEEHVVLNEISLTNLNTDAIVVYLSEKKLSGPLRAALEEVQKRKLALLAIVADRQRTVNEQVGMESEQARIRESMKVLDRTSDLYKRYVDKLILQENEFDRLKTTIGELNREELRQRSALDDYLSSLMID